MTKLIICRGLPASGKTTKALAWVAADYEHRARLNRDDFRKMLHDSHHTGLHTCERQVTAARDEALKALLRRGVSVISDDTNLPNRTVRELINLAKICEAEVEIWDLTDVDVETCVARDAARERVVGEEVIRDKYMRYVRGRKNPLPIPVESEETAGQPYVPDKHLKPAVIVDIDGTVALRGTRSPFDETRVHEDQPNVNVIKTVHAMWELGHAIVFVSGRSEVCRAATVEWLREYVKVPFTGPFMRAEGDRRNDSIVKQEIFDASVRDKYNVVCVFDDRQRVVDMWRAMGLTVFQVAPGDF